LLWFLAGLFVPVPSKSVTIARHIIQIIILVGKLQRKEGNAGTQNAGSVKFIKLWKKTRILNLCLELL